MFTALQAQINRIKEGLNDIVFKGHRKNYSIIEWLFVVPLLPTSLAIMFILSINPLFTEKLQTLSSNTTYSDVQKQFSFPIIGNGWSIVENTAPTVLPNLPVFTQ